MDLFRTKQLADANQQITELTEQRNAAQHAANQHAQASRAVKARAEAAEQAKDKAEAEKRRTHQENDILKATIAQMSGKSPFIRVGHSWHLISSIHTIAADDDGNVESVNGQSCGKLSNTMPAERLEQIVSAYHTGRRASQ